MIQKHKDIANYALYSFIWFCGIMVLLFVGFFIGYAKGTMPEYIISPYDGLLNSVNENIVFNVDVKPEYTEEKVISIVLTRISYVEIIGAIFALVLLEIGGRRLYKLLPIVKSYRNDFFKNLKSSDDKWK